MGSFKEFLENHQLSAVAIARMSVRIEQQTDQDRLLVAKRKDKRKNQADKSYTDLEIAKPKLGRGVRLHHIEAALADRKIPKRVRGKIVRAVNQLLQKKSGANPIDSLLLFQGKTLKPKAKAEAPEPAAD